MQLLCGCVGLVLFCALLAPAARALPTVAAAQKRHEARAEFERAQRLREALTGRAEGQRSKREYERVIDAYRRVYYTAPGSSKADESVRSVAELLAEEGRTLHSPRLFEAAIAQYEFLRREYPGSKYRVAALFTIGEIYREDLGQNRRAKQTFEEFLRQYPHSHLAEEAHQALEEPAEAEHSDRAAKLAAGSAKARSGAKQPGLPVYSDQQTDDAVAEGAQKDATGGGSASDQKRNRKRSACGGTGDRYSPLVHAGLHPGGD